MTPEQMKYFKGHAFCGLTPEERFWLHVDKTPGHGPEGECWIWTAYCNKHGYGQIGFSTLVTGAHRVSYELVHGPIGNTYVDCVLHTCDNPPCVNPDHLFMGGRPDNIVDMTEKGRLADFKGTLNGRHVLTEEEVRRIRVSGRTNVKLGIQYGVAPTTISAIRSGRNWKHLTD